MITIDISNGLDPQPDKPSQPRTGLRRMIKWLPRKIGLPSGNSNRKSRLLSETKHKLIR
jgi:hypothetical protein